MLARVGRERGVTNTHVPMPRGSEGGSRLPRVRACDNYTFNLYVRTRERDRGSGVCGQRLGKG